jgi:hypothetical protein
MNYMTIDSDSPVAGLGGSGRPTPKPATGHSPEQVRLPPNLTQPLTLFSHLLLSLPLT